MSVSCITILGVGGRSARSIRSTAMGRGSDFCEEADSSFQKTVEHLLANSDAPPCFFARIIYEYWHPHLLVLEKLTHFLAPDHVIEFHGNGLTMLLFVFDSWAGLPESDVVELRDDRWANIVAVRDAVQSCTKIACEFSESWCCVVIMNTLRPSASDAEIEDASIPLHE